MKHQFSQVPSVQIPRSSFDRSHGHKTTIDFDNLYPIYVDEYLPGDTANLKLNALGRLATPIFPVMDNMYLDTFFFAVPYRLVWDNWERFNGQQDTPTDSVDYLIPTITSPAATGHAPGTIFDHMGIPPGIPDLEHSALWLRAYNLIFNDWFRDENLQNSRSQLTDDGPDDPTVYALQKRGKRHDYFTSCLPFAQKDFGNPVLLPLGSQADVKLGPPITGADYEGNFPVNTQITSIDPRFHRGTLKGIDDGPMADGSAANLYADLSDATASTINELRTAFQIQRMMERDARGGTRYIEIIKSHFGVTSPDFRLQRPEYLGGGSSRIGITQVPQTTPTGIVPDVSPQGNLAGFGTVSVNGNGFTKSFTEHTLIIGLACARADLTYQNGLARMWSRQTRYDHYFPSLSHLGEQAVLNKEIFAQGSAAPGIDDQVFGYNERYSEMRYYPSLITGKFRSTDPLTLDAWHLSQDFATLPTLSGQFIQQDTPIDRVVAVPTEPDIILDMYFSLRMARPMPTYGTPGMIDHF